MKSALKLVLPLLSFALLIGGRASADAMFVDSNANTPSCTAGTPCGNIIVANGAGLFVGDLVVTVDLNGPASQYQLDRFGFDSNLSLELECFGFSSSVCSKGQFNGASLQGSKQYGPYGRFDYSLQTGLNGGQDCCKDVFTFVVGQQNGRPLNLNSLGSQFAGHVADCDTSAYVNGLPATATPEPSTLLLLGSGIAGLAAVARRTFPA